MENCITYWNNSLINCFCSGYVFKKIIIEYYFKIKLFVFLGWVGFGVADWHAFRRFAGSPTEFYGLWAYCQEQTPILGTNCQRWHTAEMQLFNGSRPSFIRTSDGLITTGMILLSLGLVVALLAMVLPLLAYVAAVLALLAFIFLLIGLPIFGRQSSNLSIARGDYSYNKRYGFWLIVPTIVLEFLAIFFFLAAGVLYRLWGYGNILTGVGGTTANLFGSQPYGGQAYAGRPYGGRQVLGPPNLLSVPAPANIPYAMAPRPFFGGSMMPPPYSYQDYDDFTGPTLLSQYLVRSLVPPNPMMLPSMGMGGFSSPSNALQFGEPYGPNYRPIINLTGQTLIGPLQRTF